MSNDTAQQPETVFQNPFSLDDLQSLDDDALCQILQEESFGLTLDQFAHALHGTSEALIARIKGLVPAEQRPHFVHELQRPLVYEEEEQARRKVLDGLFWEFTYWKTPDLYEELTQGEPLHAGIFARLEPELRAKTVLDAGAGTGRATFALLQHGARKVYAVEPSPGLLRILKQKTRSERERVQVLQGRFAALPLANHSVDLALSCSAFTADPAQGGEPGLAELVRVTRPGGKIVIVWPRVEDYAWFEAHGFQHVVMPLHHDMQVRFRSLESALECVRRFYAHNEAVVRYILTQRRPEIPFSVIGVNPPCDYYIR